MVFGHINRKGLQILDPLGDGQLVEDACVMADFVAEEEAHDVS